MAEMRAAPGRFFRGDEIRALRRTSSATPRLPTPPARSSPGRPSRSPAGDSLQRWQGSQRKVGVFFSVVCVPCVVYLFLVAGEVCR
jgi:hypothetical protein